MMYDFLSFVIGSGVSTYGFVFIGMTGIAFSGCGESSRSIFRSCISLPLSLVDGLLGDLELERRLRPDRSRSRWRSLDLLRLLLMKTINYRVNARLSFFSFYVLYTYLSLSRSRLRSLLRSFDEPRSLSSFFILSASSFSFSRSFSFSFSANEAWSFSCSSC